MSKRMRGILGILVGTALLLAPEEAFAQKARPPDEKWEFEVEASSPSLISAVVDANGKVCVWLNAHTNFVQHPEGVFTADRFQIFERTKLIRTERDLKNIPRRESVLARQPDFSDGIEWMPSGGIERDNKITFRHMKKIGFRKDEFILGPFEYTIWWSRPMGMDKSRFLYVVAEGATSKVKGSQDERALRRLRMVYKLNRDGKVVDSFLLDEAKYVEWTEAEIAELRPRTSVKWTWSKEPFYMDENGSIYAVQAGSGSRTGQSKLVVERWQMK